MDQKELGLFSGLLRDLRNDSLFFSKASSYGAGEDSPLYRGGVAEIFLLAFKNI